MLIGTAKKRAPGGPCFTGGSKETRRTGRQPATRRKEEAELPCKEAIHAGPEYHSVMRSQGEDHGLREWTASIC